MTRALTQPSGPFVNALLTQNSDLAERYRRVHVGHGPSAFATEDHRRILDACETGEREGAAIALAAHLARHAVEVIAILDPGYRPKQLRAALRDVQGV